MLWHKSLESMGMWDGFRHFLVDGPGMCLKWSCNDEFSVCNDEFSVLCSEFWCSWIVSMWNEWLSFCSGLLTLWEKVLTQVLPYSWGWGVGLLALQLVDVGWCGPLVSALLLLWGWGVGLPVFMASCCRLVWLSVVCHVLLFTAAYNVERLFVLWDVHHFFDLFPRFLAFSRAPGKATFSCIDELGNFGLRRVCFIM